MQLFVVPRSIPIVFAIPILPSWVCVLRKSKPELINFSGLRHLVLALLLAASVVAAASGASGALLPAAAQPSVRLSTDRLTTVGAQHATQVEPHAVGVGSTIVSVFQVGRFFDGGAAAIGFATSRDAGGTWRSGLLPSVTSSSSPAGSADRATDTAVAWDSVHSRWLAESLTLSQRTTAVVVSESADGLTWQAPVTVVTHPRPGQGAESTSIDKSWIACDNGVASPFRGRCYVAYTDFAGPGVNIAVQSSSDGGLTWSPAARVRVSVDVPGVQPVVRQNGQLVLVFLDGPSRLEAVRSDDGGATFTAAEVIARVVNFHRRHSTNLLRVFPLPTAAVDGAGSVYVAWSDCRFRRGCRANDIVLTHSTASGWARPRRVPVANAGTTPDHVIPGLAIDPATAGSRARLALTFYTLRAAGCGTARCRLDVRLATSATAGARWAVRRLDARAMRLTWLPRTSSGRMVGDYVSSAFAGSRAIGIFALANQPRGNRLDEAIHAAAR
jgi:hypothetical protein